MSSLFDVFSIFRKRSTYRRPKPQECVARRLRSGDIVAVDDRTATVASVSFRDGLDGEPMLYIGGRELPTAVALTITFADHEPLITHPRAVFCRQ
jgi:hypothetical protein